MGGAAKFSADIAENAHKGGKHDRQKRHVKRPCAKGPADATNLSSGFDRAEGGHGAHRIELWGKWDEVTTDVYANTASIRHYKLHGEYSANSTDVGTADPGEENGDWYPAFRHTIPAKEDSDDNGMVRFVEKDIKGKLFYRWYVVAIDANGCRSAPAWITPGILNEETPPAPTNVRIFDKGTDRVVCDWEDTPDSTDNDRRRDDQSWFVVHWSTAVDFATIYARDRKVHKTRAALKVPDADKDETFYARAFAVNDHGDKDVRSLPIPATKAGNSDPEATADGVVVGMGGKTKYPFRYTGDLALLTEADSPDLELDEALSLKKVRARVKQAPTGADIVIGLYKNNVSIGTVTIADGAKRGVDDTWSETFADQDVISNSIDQVGSTTPGKNLTVVWVFE
jgi:hypothetical protein